MCLALAALELPARRFGFAAVALTIAGTWVALAHTVRPRDPIASYTAWDGYWHPIGFYNRLTREKAEEMHAAGQACMVGEYNETGQLVRATKFLRGEIFLSHNYSYHDHGRLKTARVARGGRETLLRYDARVKVPEGQRGRL